MSVRATLPEIERLYVKTGKVQLVHLDLPLRRIHPEAFQAAEAGDCASEQGKFWEYRWHLFANQGDLSAEKLSEYAVAVGLEVDAFGECLASGRHTDAVQQDIRQAEKGGARGTPTFFLGRRKPGSDRVKILDVIRGAEPFEVFQQKIDALLDR